MLIEIGRECSLARLCAERKHGRTLLEQARTDPSLFGTPTFDFECLDWTESLAFAINFAFNGNADAFLETLGHNKHDEVPGRRPLWTTRDEQIYDLSLHLTLLDKWYDKLVELFGIEKNEHFRFLDRLAKQGGVAPRRSLQIACQLEHAQMRWTLDAFVHDKLVVLDTATDSVRITDNGIEYHSLLRERDPDMAIPDEIRKSVAELRRDHPDPSKAGFIIMRFGNTRAHATIVDAIRSTLARFDLVGLRADDKEYHSDLYHNIMTYMHGCGFAVAAYERLESEDFNPNVSLEVGGMLVMDKPVCLLKDKTLRTLNTDLAGKMYRQFDPQNPASTINEVLTKWLHDKGIA